MQDRSSQQQPLHNIAQYIHQAVLNPHLDKSTLHEVCEGAKHFGLAGLCTNLLFLPAARERLGKRGATKLIAVIAFPFGIIPSELKLAEAEWAAEKGAEELDVVPNFSALNQGKTDSFAEDIAQLCSIGLPVRTILDMSQLKPELLSLAVEASIDAGVSGVQSGNGFGQGVTADQIQQLKKLAKGRCAIKAAGGLHSVEQSIELIKAGASQLGTSKGLEIIRMTRSNQK